MSKRSLQINPALKLATWEDIKAKRNALIESPIQIGGNVFDADERSILRMDEAMLVPSAVEFGWKLHDNTFVRVTPHELREVRIAIARRTGLLFVAGESLRMSGPHQVKDLDNPSLWGLPTP